jgi:SAM-dependent methyltransferase
MKRAPIASEGRDAADWVAYWDGLAEGHLLFREEADTYVARLAEAIPLDGMRVLDFGCGYGFVAEGLAPRVGSLWLWDAAPSMREHARRRLSGASHVHVIDEVAEAPDGGFDLILVNSVIQYMTEAEFLDRLRDWRGRLAPGGRVVVSDLIPPRHSTLADLFALAAFSVRRGYAIRAARCILAERRRYAAMTRARPLYCVGEADLRRLAAMARLDVEVLPRNLSHFPRRLAAVLSAGAGDAGVAP